MSRRALAKIAIAHAYFDVIGGGEELALRIAMALTDMGHEVTLLTGAPVDMGRLSSLLGVDVSGVRSRIIRSRASGLLASLTPGRSVRLRRLLFYERLFKSNIIDEYDLVIDTQSNVTSKASAVYIHFPVIYATARGGIVGALYNWLVGNRAKSVLGKPRLVMTNSTWTAERVKEAYGVEPSVLHPPVEVEAFSKALEGPHDEDAIVTVSRLSPEKNLEFIVDVAARMEDLTFYIVGSTRRGLSEQVISRIRTRSRELGVNNVQVLPDLPRDRLIELMSRAKAYLHPPFPEHFGIAVAEAMAAGLPPVVYRDGGAWTDMASQVDIGLGYTTVEEAVSALRRAVENRETLAIRANELAKDFTYPAFKARLEELLRPLLSGN